MGSLVMAGRVGLAHSTLLWSRSAPITSLAAQLCTQRDGGRKMGSSFESMIKSNFGAGGVGSEQIQSNSRYNFWKKDFFKHTYLSIN